MLQRLAGCLRGVVVCGSSGVGLPFGGVRWVVRGGVLRGADGWKFGAVLRGGGLVLMGGEVVGVLSSLGRLGWLVLMVENCAHGFGGCRGGGVVGLGSVRGLWRSWWLVGWLRGVVGWVAGISRPLLVVGSSGGRSVWRRSPSRHKAARFVAGNRNISLSATYGFRSAGLFQKDFLPIDINQEKSTENEGLSSRFRLLLKVRMQQNGLFSWKKHGNLLFLVKNVQ